MIASISASGGVFVPAPKTRSYPYFFAMPDMSSKTNSLVTKASGWMAWSMIQQALHQQERKGDAAAAMSGWLKCGLRQLASNAGCDIKTIRQQVIRLEKVGLIRILRKQPRFAISPTGQLVRKGRHPRIEIVLNVGLEHFQPPKAEPNRGESPPMAEPIRGESPILNRGESPPHQRNKELNTEQPNENTAGVGVSSAGEAAAPPIAYPASRITPKPRSAAKDKEYPPRRLSAYGEAPAPAVTWTDPRFEQARQRCQDEQAARDSENAKWESERLAQSCK